MEENVTIPWYQEGLRFKCTECGGCCTGADGYVFLGKSDLIRLAKHMHLPPKIFAQKYTRKVDGKYALIDQNVYGDCIFLKEKKCSVYEARPVQCRTFPWWVQNIEKPEDWEEAARYCEGINHIDAPVIPLTHIKKEERSYLNNLLEQNFLV